MSVPLFIVGVPLFVSDMTLLVVVLAIYSVLGVMFTTPGHRYEDQHDRSTAEIFAISWQMF